MKKDNNKLEAVGNVSELSDLLDDKKAMLTKEEALAYCYKNADMYKFENGETAFEFLILSIKNDRIKPDELYDYGMDY